MHLNHTPSRPHTMRAREEKLLQQLQALDIGQRDEQAALYADLAEAVAREDPAKQAAYLRKAYELRLHGVADAIQQGSPPPTGAAATAEQQQQQQQCGQLTAAPAPAGVSENNGRSRHSKLSSNSSSSSSAGGSSEGSSDAWDASDGWEPDLTQLRKASSFERERAANASQHQQQQQQQQRSSGLQSRAPQPHAASPAALASDGRSALSEPASSARAASSAGNNAGSWRSSPSKADAEGSWRGPDRGGAGAAASRPRGRGQSKLGLASTDSEDEAVTQLTGVVREQPHIVEIYGLTRAVTSTHLEDFALNFLWGGTAPNIKWVDDEHALAVFPCAEAAAVLLGAAQSQYKVRPFSRASRGALSIPAEELTPPRAARPMTTTAVARRLISNALGNREVRDKAAERHLAELRRANKAERQQRQQGLAEAWGDD